MRITVTRILETSRFLATEAGQQLNDFVTYVAETMEQVIRTLRQGITFADNVRCQLPIISVKHDTWTTVNTSSAQPLGILLQKATGAGLTSIDGFLWQVTSDGLIQVKAKLVGVTDADLSLIVLVP